MDVSILIQHQSQVSAHPSFKKKGRNFPSLFTTEHSIDLASVKYQGISKLNRYVVVYIIKPNDV